MIGQIEVQRKLQTNVLMAIKSLIENGDFIGTAGELLRTLSEEMGRTEPSIDWPRNAISLGRNLNGLESQLNAVGIQELRLEYVTIKRVLTEEEQRMFDRKYRPTERIIVLTKHPERYLGSNQLVNGQIG